MDRVCGIYMITSPSGKIYIGQSIDISERISAYRKLRCKNQPKLFESIKKYGLDLHEIAIIHRCEPIELNDLEIFYIDLYKTFGTDHGMNLQSGGNSNYTTSKETREKLRQFNLGKKMSPETKRKISYGNKGKIVSTETSLKISLALTGKKLSEEHRNKISNRVRLPVSQKTRSKLSQALKGRVVDPSVGLKISISKKGRFMESNNKNSKPILQITINGDVVKKWDCSIQVARVLGYHSSHINECCNGKRKTSNGFKWNFA